MLGLNHVFMFKIVKKLMLLVGSPASNPASCHPSPKKEDDCLQTWVLLKAGDRGDNKGGLRVTPAYADSLHACTSDPKLSFREVPRSLKLTFSFSVRKSVAALLCYSNCSCAAPLLQTGIAGAHAGFLASSRNEISMQTEKSSLKKGALGKCKDRA